MTDISRRHLIQTAAGLAAVASAQPVIAQGAAKNSNAIRARMGLGADIIYVNAANGTPIIIREEGKSTSTAGDLINFSPRDNMVHRFDAQGGRLN